MTILIELSSQFKSEFYIRSKETINYRHIHVYLCKLLYFYNDAVHRNTAQVILANLPKFNVTIHHLRNRRHQITRLETAMMRLIRDMEVAFYC